MRNLKREIALFEYLMKRYKLKNDKELSTLLCSSPSVISRIRNGELRITAKMILFIYDKTKLSIEDIRRMVEEEV
jgi:hypothetical protein